MKLDGAKEIRDAAIIALLGALTAAEIRRLDLANVNSGVVLLAERAISLTPPQHDALGRWLAIRPMVANGGQALFVSLHWTPGRKQPGGRISYDGLRRTLGGVRSHRKRLSN